MCLTGFFLACTLGCKMVGLFTFLAVGTCVLVDLWDVIDIRKQYPIVRLSPRLDTFLKAYIGTCHEALLRARSWSYCFAILRLSLVLLDSLQSLVSFGDRRPFHEPCIPRVSARQRTVAQGTWYVIRA